MMPYLVAAAIRTYLITLPEHQRRGGAAGQLATSGIRAANKGSRRFHNHAPTSAVSFKTPLRHYAKRATKQGKKT